MEYSLIGAVVGLITLVIINGMMIEYTTFSLIMALASTINGFVFTFCTFKALKTINLSLYSLFSMLGGMLLPFIQGILFFGEEFTVAKFISVGVIALALILTVEKGKRKNGTIYYIGIFVLNGIYVVDYNKLIVLKNKIIFYIQLLYKNKERWYSNGFTKIQIKR